jgi:hypothetical protein
MEDGNDVRAVFWDMSRAFDRVWHRGLLHKLKCFSVHGSSARKVAILLAIGDREFTFGELSMKAGCHLANKNYGF